MRNILSEHFTQAYQSTISLNSFFIKVDFYYTFKHSTFSFFANIQHTFSHIILLLFIFFHKKQHYKMNYTKLLLFLYLYKKERNYYSSRCLNDYRFKGNLQLSLGSLQQGSQFLGQHNVAGNLEFALHESGLRVQFAQTNVNHIFISNGDGGINFDTLGWTFIDLSVLQIQS